MNTLQAVVTELGQFAIASIRDHFTQPRSSSLIAPPISKVLPQRNQVLIEDASPRTDEPEGVSSFQSLKTVLAERTPEVVVTQPASVSVPSGAHTITGQPMTIAADDVLLYEHPTKEFDAVLMTLPYGASVRLEHEQGSWAKVSYTSTAGWVERDQLATNQAQVRPYFVIKEYCGPDSETTKRLRRMIGDEFHAGQAGLPLQAEEYAYYKLFTRGLFLPTVAERPRQAGRWQKLFAGTPGVHVSVRPKTGSVMEFVTAGDEGRLAYVEAVFPDESISLSEVGEPVVGYYNERTLSKEVWQAHKPVFIQFS